MSECHSLALTSRPDYTWPVTAAHDYEELHSLVDQLTPIQAQALRAVTLQLLVSRPQDAAAPLARRRTLSFAGIMDAEPDLAERFEDILRAELGRHSA
jgi:hypothetical protein